MRMRINSFFVLPIVFVGLFCTAQVKHEKETRIKSTELPSNVTILLPQITLHAKRIKYYREFDGSKHSFELKLKRNGIHYSIEFNQEGILEDIELLVSISELPLAVVKAVESQFQRYKLTRIQKQFTHTKGSDPKKTLQNVFDGKMSVSAYEIVVAGKTNLGYKQVEFLFDTNGKILNKRPIIIRGYDNIMF